MTANYVNYLKSLYWYITLRSGQMRYLELPIIIGGEEINPSIDSENYVFEYKNLEVKMPKMNEVHRKKIDSIDGDSIHDLSLNDIVVFFSRLAMLWRDPEYHYRKLLLEIGPIVTGQSAEMYKHNIGIMLSLFASKGYLQDMVQSELNNKLLIDEWVPYFNAYIHAEPLGRLLHVVSGNVPVAGVYSTVRGVLTKNVNTIKLSSRDIITTLLFIQSFKDVDKNHPITRSTSAIYWERNEEDIINHFVKNANGMCLWGGKDTVEFYKSKAKAGCEIIEYGPKTSAQIIKWDKDSDRELPLWAARDICLFDQEACLSPQIIYFQGDADLFIERLAVGLRDYTKLWPKAQNEIDHYAHMNYVIKANAFCENYSTYEENLDWLIVDMSKNANISLEHPLGRTIYIFRLENIKDCLKYIDSNIQTVGVFPKSLAYELKDGLSRKGVLRISNIGFVDAPRSGLVHNSQYLSRLVRICGVEREVTFRYSEYDLPENYFNDFKFYLLWDEKSNKSNNVNSGGK